MLYLFAVRQRHVCVCVCVCVCMYARTLPVSPWTSATSSKFATEMNPGASGVLDGTERRRSQSSTSLCDGRAGGRYDVDRVTGHDKKHMDGSSCSRAAAASSPVVPHHTRGPGRERVSISRGLEETVRLFQPPLYCSSCTTWVGICYGVGWRGRWHEPGAFS